MKKIILICLCAILLIGIVFYLVTRQIHIKSGSLSDYLIFDAYVDQKLSDEGMMIFPDADTVKQYSKSNVSNEVRKNEEAINFLITVCLLLCMIAPALVENESSEYVTISSADEADFLNCVQHCYMWEMCRK